MPVSSQYNALAPRTVEDYDNQAMHAQAGRMGLMSNALALQSGQMQMQQQQNALAQRSALTQAIQSGQIDLSNPSHAPRALALAPDVAPGMLTAIGTYQKDRALVAKDEGAAANSQQEARTKALQLHQSMLPLVRTPQDMGVWIDGMFSNPATRDAAVQVGGSPEQAKARIPQDPEQFKQFLQMNAMGMDKYIKDQTDQRGQDITSKTQLATNAATNKTHIQTTGMQQAGENQRAKLQRETQLTVAGMGPDGKPSENVEAMAQAIAKGQTAPIGGFALARPQGQAVMARVMQINPEYDATAYGAKVKAAKDFSTGQQGNSMRSFAVAGQHLDQLNSLVDALNNGNTQLANKIGNAYAEATGNPAPTNFDAAKDVVSKEVVKAIVAGGGGVSERQELSDLMGKAKSPAQLKGVIQQYRGLMSAQHDALLQQRRAAGLPDSTLPKYTDPSGEGGGMPKDIADLLKKHGK